jgi:1-acyl-sn-glycerol-3-phosphate acyltransferase
VTLIRSALFNAYFFAMTFLLCVAGYPLSKIAPARTIAIPRLWARLALAGARAICGIRYEVTGLDHVPQRGPALIASRHQSAFDTMVWMLLLPRTCYVIKQELERIPLFGALIRPSGMILVDRSAGAAALRHLMHETDRAIAQDRQIVIFPEGTRSEPGRMAALQPGIAAMAARAKIPVIPVSTNSGEFWGRRAFRKKPGTIRIALGSPIPSGLKREELMPALASALADNPVDAVDKSVG